MAVFDIKNIGIYEDDVNDLDIIQNIIHVNKREDAFYILDIETIARQHKKWILAMPKVFPHYAIKCNPDPNVIRVLASLNGRFDCASKHEIQLVMQAGVLSDNIIYANPTKPPSHIRFAKKVGVKILMIDSQEEVLKIKEIYPEAKLVIRIAIDGDTCGIKFSKKFGCEPTIETTTLMNFVREHDMCLQGFSFHLGSPCWDSSAFGRGIEICKELIKAARHMGFNEANIIDIGGGVPGLDEDTFNKIAESVNQALEDIDPTIEVISEPGRYYVESAFILATYIHSKRINYGNEMLKRNYYINEGVFGSFFDELMGIEKRLPIPLCNSNSELFPSAIWGQTCNSIDCVVDDMMIQDLPVGSWIVWKNMGSYTISIASTFNGFTPSAVIPVIRKTALKELLNDIDIVQESGAIRNISAKERDSNSVIAHWNSRPRITSSI